MLSQLARYAAELDVVVEEAEVEVRMSYETSGKLGLDDIPPTCRELSYAWRIESDSETARLVEVLGRIERGCHALNTVRDPVPVSGRLIHAGEETPL